MNIRQTFFLSIFFFLFLSLLPAAIYQCQPPSETCIFSPLKVFFETPALHPYHDANLSRPKSDFDVFNQSIKLGNQDDYEIIDKVGKGKFAKVYSAKHKPTGDTVAFKLFQDTSEQKILWEIKMLNELKDTPNFLPLRDVIREEGDDDVVRYALVFDYFEALHYKELFPTLNKSQIKYYIYETLRTLDSMHSRGIMHRDIKGLNVLMTTDPLVVKVIDVGHANYYLPGQKLSVRVASLHFKAPELLLNMTTHDYAIDIWSAGCLLAEMVFQKFHFFQSTVKQEKGKGESNNDVKMREFADHLEAIASVMGSAKLRQYADKYKDGMVLTALNAVKNHEKKPLKSFINEKNQHLVDDDVIDLLEKMLIYDHRKRITAKEALEHPYFDEFRKNGK